VPSFSPRLKELERTDDLGLSLPYLAVFYDRPDMLRYLRKRGFNLKKPCDPMGFGTPMFYAVYLGHEVGHLNDYMSNTFSAFDRKSGPHSCFAFARSISK
jgi:hypothetical protein